MTNFENLAAELETNCGEKRLAHLAKQLAVAESALRELGVGWQDSSGCFSFPERDANMAVIGIGLRQNQTGKKWQVEGSRRGLLVPRNFDELDGPIFVPEGPSDVAALISLEVAAVGRPSATGGRKLLAQFLKQYFNREIYIVGDNDEKKDGSWPGKHGAFDTAQFVADQLNRDVKWAMPPDKKKDVRAWITAY